MDYTDFHCHLDSRDYENKRQELIDKIISSGVTTIVTVADPYEEESHKITRGIVERNENLIMMTAAHPHNAKDYSSKVEKKIFDLSSHNKAIGIGEAGLDFHYNLSTPDDQRRVFRRQIDIAKELSKPLILHSRKAESEIIKILEESKFEHLFTNQNN